YLQNQLYQKDEILKLYYKGPFFRYERPQAGRERQFHQFGVEGFGSMNPAIDAEIIYLGNFILKTLGLKNFEILLGNVGCPVCRPKYEKLITSTLKEYCSQLCEDCKIRYSKNPLRMLDCKNENCRKYIKKIPPLSEYLCDDCRKHLKGIEELLTLLEIDYKVSPHLVRGLDYYTHTTFEFVYPSLAAQATLIGGGRYNNLVKEFGGPSIPACGFAGGMERIIAALKNEGKKLSQVSGLDVFIIPIGSNCFKAAFKLLQEIRAEGISSDMDYRESSSKSQMRRADKLQVLYTIIIGEDELGDGVVKLKEMKTGDEKNIKLENIIEELRKRLSHD
ncbi:MAG: histidine--tRNA ligase, partial [Candidatus Ratteibacteria bacterium]|nr:histidine--tRNA ligase [Candidatus Ratteibacteria bacterium]